MHIQSAKPDDRNYISDSCNNILKHHQVFNAFYKPVEKNVVATNSERIELVAFENGERIGCIVGVITSSPVDRSEPYATIQAVWVEENMRGSGVAKELVTEFEKTISAKNIRRVELFVDLKNISGKRLWDAEGYEAYQERRYKNLT